MERNTWKLDRYDYELSDLIEKLEKPFGFFDRKNRRQVMDKLKDLQVCTMFIRDWAQAEEDGDLVWLDDLDQDEA